MRPIIILAGLTFAAAVPVAAHTFGVMPGATPPPCLTIGNTTYRLGGGGNADVAARIDPSAAAPGLRIALTETPEEADFVLVDDGAAPNCRTATNLKEVDIAAGTTADLTPETAAALFAAAHRPPRKLAGRHARPFELIEPR